MFNQKIRQGFTLIELLIAITIAGLAVMAVAPVVGEKVSAGDEQVKFFEDLFKEHLKEAGRVQAPVSFKGFKGSANILTYDNKRISIPGITSIQSAYINSNNAEGLEYNVTVYPDGLCDHFVLVTDRATLIESRPLLLTVIKRKGSYYTGKRL